MGKSIWPKASSKRVAKALEAHSVIALALGGLIYILALTGTVLVFNHELQRWEQPGIAEMTAITPEAAARAATAVFESEETPSTHLFINFPQPDLPRTVITTDTQAFFADADGAVVAKENFPWTQFLLDLHYYLHLPQILGLTVVGALGAFLIAMSLSGFLAHPRIFRDAFTFRRGAGRVPLTDLHNRLSVWTAPFHITNALTGAVLGLASILAFAIAAVLYDNDTGEVFDPVFGSEPAPLEGEAPLANIAGPLQYMQASYPELSPTYFILHDPTTPSQHSTVIGKHGDRLIFGDYYNFDAEGNFLGNVGISDGTIGQQIIGSVYNVHFGNWGGLPVKLAYGVFGLALSVIIASGLRIYFIRRREKGRAAPRLEAGWEGVVWGTPCLLALTQIGALSGIITGGMLTALFWLGLIGLLIIALRVGDGGRVRLQLKFAVSALLLSSVLLHGIINWKALSLMAAWPVSLSFLIASGLIAFTARQSIAGHGPAALSPTAAE